MTTRATLGRSFDGDCRHLFRHLREPSELLRNPLVSACFSQEAKGAARLRAHAAAATTIREAVRRLADYCLQSDRLEDEEVALHRHSIVIDGDIGGMRRKRLAAKLGISARQYTRLQHDMRRRISLLLVSEL